MKEEKEEKPKIVLTIKMTPDDREMLSSLAQSCYRGVTLSQAVRWLIQDKYKELNNDSQSVNPKEDA